MKGKWKKIIPGILIVIVTTGTVGYSPFPSGKLWLLIFQGVCWIIPTWCANWPLEPRDQFHPVLTIPGEFLEVDRGINDPPGPPIATFHTGVDIYDQFPAGATSGTPPFVLTKDAGVVTELQQASCSEKCTLEILTSSGQRQSYSHWDSDTLSQEIRDAYDYGMTIDAGTRVAQLAWWPSCGYHHLHFQVCNGDSCEDPLPGLYPKERTDQLQISKIYFETNDVSNTPSTFSGAPPTVNGQVDIVVEAADLQAKFYKPDGSTFQGSTSIHAIAYEISDATGTVRKPISTIDFSHVQNPLYFDEEVDPSRAVFLFQNSSDSYCSGKRFQYVITNVPCNDPSGCKTVLNDALGTKFGYEHSWDTQETENGIPKYPNGIYTIKVTVWDHVSTSISATQSVNVAN